MCVLESDSVYLSTRIINFEGLGKPSTCYFDFVVCDVV